MVSNLITKAALYWILGFGGSALLQVKLKRIAWRHDVYMLTVSLVGFFVFRDLFLFWEPKYLVVLVCSFLLNALVGGLLYKVGRRWGAKPTQLINNSSRMIFLQLQHRFLFSKSYELIFQQIGVYGLMLGIIGLVGSDKAVYLGALLFGLLHIPILFGDVGFGYFKYIFFIASFLIGGVFAMLIGKTPYALIWTYTIHMQLYVLAGLYFWFNNKSFTFKSSKM